MASYVVPDNTRNSFTRIRILVVDDATACLNIVSAILKSFKHEVVTAIHGIDALTKLERSRGQFDLVVTDYYMPYMNGLELQERIQEQYGLPVIIMSADDTEGVMVRCLEQGAVFFLVKPIRPVELKNIWQYAFKGRKGKSVATERVERPIEGFRPLRIADTTPNCDPNSKQHNQEQSQSRNIVIQDRILSERNPHDPGEKRRPEAGKKKDKGKTSGMAKPKRPYASPRKKKVNWTVDLHNLFLQAVDTIGIESVQPKKILDLMKIPGLTRQTIASHLQKYRIYLKESKRAAGGSQPSATPTGLLPPVAGEPDVTAVNTTINSHPLPALQPDDRSYLTHDYNRSHHAGLFPSKKPLNDQTLSNSHDRPIALWPKSTNRQASWKKTATDSSQSIGPVLESGTASMYHQSNSTAQRSPVNPISFGSGSSSAQSQLGNPRQMHMHEQQQSLVAPKRFASRLLGYGEAASGMSNIDSIIGGAGAFANYLAPPPLPLKPNSNNSYAGIRLSGYGNSLGVRQTQPKPNSVVGAAENNRANYVSGFPSMSGTTHTGTLSLTGPGMGKFSTSTGPGTFSTGNEFTPGGSSSSTFWHGSTSEGIPGANDHNPIPDAPLEVENPFALEELIKTVLGETDDIPNNPIPGEGCSNDFSSENTMYQSVAPDLQVHVNNPILDVENELCQVQAIVARGSSRGANSSAWNEPSQRQAIVAPGSSSGVNSSAWNEPSHGQAIAAPGSSSGAYSSAWNEPSHGQHLSFHGNPKGKEIAQITADFFPDFDDQNPNQVHSISVGQGSGTNPVAANDNNTMQPIGNLTSTASEELDDDFIDSLLSGFDEVGPSQ